MRIKRFNENQQYLTDPFDPEFHIQFELNGFKKWVDNLYNQLKFISKELELNVEFDDKQTNNIQYNFHCTFEFYSDKYNRLYNNFNVIVVNDFNKFFIFCRTYKNELYNHKVKDLEELKEYIKNYFENYAN